MKERTKERKEPILSYATRGETVWAESCCRGLLAGNEAVKRIKRRHILAAVVLFSLIGGPVGSSIRWGPEDSFHGQGFPVPTVLWDRASIYYDHVTQEDDYFIPFCNPLAVFLNPLAVFLTAMSVWGVVEVGLFLARRFVRRHKHVSPGCDRKRTCHK